MLVEKGFAVVCEDPQDLFALIRDATNLHKPVRSGEQRVVLANLRQVAELQPEDGLFSDLRMYMRISDTRGIRCYRSSLVGNYRDKTDAVWTEEEREKLAELLTVGASMIDLGMKPAVKTDKTERFEVYHEVFVANPARDLRFGVGPLYDTEKARWTAQVRFHNEALRELDQVLASDLKQALRRNLFKLIDTNQALPGRLDIDFTGLEDDGTACALALRPENFFDRIRTWHQFAEMAVRVVSELKGNPQTGILIIHS